MVTLQKTTESHHLESIITHKRNNRSDNNSSVTYAHDWVPTCPTFSSRLRLVCGLKQNLYLKSSLLSPLIRIYLHTKYRR